MSEKDEHLNPSTRNLLRKVLEEVFGTGMQGRADSVLQQLLQNDDVKTFLMQHFSIKVDMNQPDEVFVHQEKRLYEDKLDDIWRRNCEFTDYAKETNPRRIDMSQETFMCRLHLAMYDELTEMLKCIPWKWWGRGVWELNDELKEKALDEAIDFLHFYLEFCRAIGANPTEVYRAYIKKNDKNWERFEKKEGWNKHSEEAAKEEE